MCVEVEARKSCFAITLRPMRPTCHMQGSNDVALVPHVARMFILPAAASLRIAKRRSSSKSCLLRPQHCISISLLSCRRRLHTVALLYERWTANMRLLSLPAFLSVLAFTSALPTAPADKPLPLLIWHGLGDKYDADGLRSTGKLAEKVNPGTFVYYIRLDEDGNSDRTATFFGKSRRRSSRCARISKTCRNSKRRMEAVSEQMRSASAKVASSYEDYCKDATA